eukprot:COSAG01_NODE_49640_length_370_cov_1.136531_1_plen_72_part_10
MWQIRNQLRFSPIFLEHAAATSTSVTDNRLLFHFLPKARKPVNAEDFLCFFKQKTAYEILRSDWSSDVCSSD